MIIQNIPGYLETDVFASSSPPPESYSSSRSIDYGEQEVQYKQQIDGVGCSGRGAAAAAASSGQARQSCRVQAQNGPDLTRGKARGSVRDQPAPARSGVHHRGNALPRADNPVGWHRE